MHDPASELPRTPIPRTPGNRGALTVVVPCHILPLVERRRTGRPPLVDTFLTLVIAVGGIATGIGAIWAALAARRQAQITERSLALTERSLAEQNERSRLNLEVDLLTRMADRWEMPHFLSRRRTAADYLLNNAIVGEDIVEVRRLPKAVFDVCNYFEELGDLQRFGVLQATSVWNRFGTMAQAYWLTCEPSLTKRREERADLSCL